MNQTPPRPDIDRETFAKVLRDLARLSPRASRLDVEVAVWRSVIRHTRAATAEQATETTWQILNRLAGAAKNAA